MIALLMKWWRKTKRKKKEGRGKKIGNRIIMKWTKIHCNWISSLKQKRFCNVCVQIQIERMTKKGATKTKSDRVWWWNGFYFQQLNLSTDTTKCATRYTYGMTGNVNVKPTTNCDSCMNDSYTCKTHI